MPNPKCAYCSRRYGDARGCQYLDDDPAPVIYGQEEHRFSAGPTCRDCGSPEGTAHHVTCMCSECATCHGLEVHRFVPVDSTCGQSQCHENTPMKLAKMQGQTSLHCVSCHQFTRPVSEQISTDSAGTLLSPANDECMQCHQMKERMGNFAGRGVVSPI